MAFSRTILGMLCAAAVGVSAWGQGVTDPADPAPTPSMPAAPVPDARLVHLFDFEERAKGNYEEMPMHWFRVQEPGFPLFTSLGFDGAVCRSAGTSFKLQLNGGSAAGVLESGVIPVLNGANYRISGYVQTRGCRYSRARLIAYFLDGSNRPIPASRQASELIESNGRWSLLSLDLSGRFEAAAWLVLRVELVQPEQYRVRQLGSHELFEQDIDAAAWFDDIAIQQVPRIELSAPPTGIFRAPGKPGFQATVLDQTGQPLDVSIRVFDSAGRYVDRLNRRLDGNQPGQWSWQPALPGLGWYGAQMEVSCGGRPIGRALAALLWLPPLADTPDPEMDRFVLDLEQPPRENLEGLRAMLGQLECKAVGLWVWPPRPAETSPLLGATAPTTAPSGQTIDGVDTLFIKRLAEDDRALTLTIAGMSPELAQQARTDPDQPLALLSREPQLWRPMVDGMLAQVGTQARRWQIGSGDDTEAAFRTDLPAVYAQLTTQFRRFVSDPVLSLPWSAQLPMGPAVGVLDLCVLVPTSVRPENISLYLADLPANGPVVGLDLATLEAGRFSHADRAVDLAQRMIYGWAAQPQRLILNRPWAWAADGAVVPDPLLGVWANLAPVLAGRRLVGKLPLEEGLECWVLDGRRGGALLVWNRSNPRGLMELDSYLADAPMVYDLWGNRVPVIRRGAIHEVPVGEAPLRIEGIDVNMARFRAAFSLDPDFASSMYSVHQHQIKLFNPWPTTITGRLRFTGLGDWQISPRQATFNIPAGQVASLPVELTFPAGELEGRKRLVLAVDLEADRTYHMEMPLELRIGLEDVVFQPTVSIERDAAGRPTDLLVTQMISNLGSKPRSLYVFALIKDRPRQELVVTDLRPGQSVIKSFRFVGAGAGASGTVVRVGLRETDGGAVLNKAVEVP